jgi:hypothetical protein
MPRADVVAALAQLGHFASKKAVVIAAMRLMAGAAVLNHGRMLKGVRPLLFRVARVAEVRDGIGIEHVLAEAPVSRMAIGAFHLALGYGVVGLPVELASLLFVARDAHAGLGFFQVEAAIGVDRVAVLAGHIVFLVEA